MTQYADYDYYKSVYKGDMPKLDFDKMSKLASAKIKANTFGRIDEKNVCDTVKHCTCVIAEMLLTTSKSAGKTSESVGSWSVQYADSREGKETIAQVLKEFLSEVYASDGTPLLYRGC